MASSPFSFSFFCVCMQHFFLVCMYVTLQLCAIGIMCSKAFKGQVGARQAVALHIVGVVLLAYS